MWRRCFLGWAQDFLEPKHSHRSLVRMLISEVSVRCTGHLLAISSSRECCSALKGPSNRTSRSILSSMPSLLSHSEQSAAYIFECRSQTVTRSSGQFFFRAYIPTVIEVQEPRAASKNSYGDGPVSLPPTLSGSSPFSRCRPAAICCANVPPSPQTMTSADVIPSRTALIFTSQSPHHMMSTRFSTPPEPKTLHRRATSTHNARNSKLSHALDVIVKSLA
jgi:hypothetical protein